MDYPVPDQPRLAKAIRRTRIVAIVLTAMLPVLVVLLIVGVVAVQGTLWLIPACLLVTTSLSTASSWQLVRKMRAQKEPVAADPKAAP